MAGGQFLLLVLRPLGTNNSPSEPLQQIWRSETLLTIFVLKRAFSTELHLCPADDHVAASSNSHKCPSPLSFLKLLLLYSLPQHSTQFSTSLPQAQTPSLSVQTIAESYHPYAANEALDEVL
jgi:hypothetical protein